MTWCRREKSKVRFKRSHWIIYGTLEKKAWKWSRFREMYSPMWQNTRKCVHKRMTEYSTKIVFFRCKKRDRNKRRRKLRSGQTTDFFYSSSLSVHFFASSFFCCLFLFLHPKKTVFVKSMCVLLRPCVPSHWWVRFPRPVLFCQPHQQPFTRSLKIDTCMHIQSHMHTDTHACTQAQTQTHAHMLSLWSRFTEPENTWSYM